MIEPRASFAHDLRLTFLALLLDGLHAEGATRLPAAPLTRAQLWLLGRRRNGER